MALEVKPLDASGLSRAHAWHVAVPPRLVRVLLGLVP